MCICKGELHDSHRNPFGWVDKPNDLKMLFFLKSWVSYLVHSDSTEKHSHRLAQTDAKHLKIYNTPTELSQKVQCS